MRSPSDQSACPGHANPTIDKISLKVELKLPGVQITALALKGLGNSLETFACIEQCHITACASRPEAA
jgi:hypothetical protein